MPIPRVHESRFRWQGDEYRVIVFKDVVSIPGVAGCPGWSMGGFGARIGVDWLLREGGLPGSASKRRALAEMIVAAVQAAGDAPPQVPHPPTWPWRWAGSLTLDGRQLDQLVCLRCGCRRTVPAGHRPVECGRCTGHDADREVAL